MKVFLAISALLFIISCNSGSSNISTTGQSVEEKDTVATSSQLTPGCYRMVIQRDTAHMKLEVNGDSVNGSLFYKPYETDASFGKFAGRFEDGVIHAWYTFESEGLISYRMVAYKVVDEGFAEGYGDIDTSNDSAWFKYPHALKFEDEHPFKKVDCE